MNNRAEVLDIDSSSYPSVLKNIPNPPKKLFFRGVLDPKLFTNCLGVVGSRIISPYGSTCIKTIFNTLDFFNINVVSGFMSGVDFEAHSQTVSHKGKTLAFLPCGIDYAFSGSFKFLQEQIISTGGLILSEFEGFVPPKKWSYPRRNRLIAGLCFALLVIEARINSGSLNTVMYARKYGRKILCLPISIFSPYCDACCQLVNSGAGLVKCGRDINKIFSSEPCEITLNASNLLEGPSDNVKGSVIIDALNMQPLTLDELVDISKLSVVEVNRLLTSFLLSGKLEESQGRFYVC